MKVREWMTSPAETCPLDADLSTAAMIMWWRDCGALPVTAPDSTRVVGMITDRDICMATATRRQRPDQIRVGEVISGQLVALDAEDPLETALERMAEARVRRLPVVDRDGAAVGLLSINDVILQTPSGRSRSKTGCTPERVLQTLRSVGQHRTAPAEVAAGG